MHNRSQNLVAALALLAFPLLACDEPAVIDGESGLGVGEKVTPFHPYHVSGPDKGTDTCPP